MEECPRQLAELPFLSSKDGGQWKGVCLIS